MPEQVGDDAIPEPRPAFDDFFVASAKRTEPSAAERIANANRIAAGHESLANHGPGPIGARRHGASARAGWRTANPVRLRSARTWLPIVVASSIVAAVAVAQMHGRQAVAGGIVDGVFGSVTARPPVHDFPNPTRILPAPATVPGSGGYTVLNGRGDNPVAWDPCQPIHFVVRAAGEIPGGRPILDKAMAEISKDTGLFFMDDGSTTEAPAAERDPYQPDRYGRNWAPVLISWSDPGEYPALQGNVVGLAGPVAFRGKDARAVSGQVVFDAPELTEIERISQGTTYVYDVMLHELGHLVGLGHVDDPNEVMNPVSMRPLPGYGPGDLRGLAALGSGRCFTTG